ncbi:MAG: hypothetical protein ACRD2C_08710 [Acidimicrobiales bacterium]
MCAACVAQGVTYVGGALAGLQVMAVRARAKRGRAADDAVPADALDPSLGDAEPVEPDLARR